MNRRFPCMCLHLWLPDWDCAACSRCSEARPARLATIQSWFDNADGKVRWWCGCCGEAFEVATPVGPQFEGGIDMCPACDAWMDQKETTPTEDKSEGAKTGTGGPTR